MHMANVPMRYTPVCLAVFGLVASLHADVTPAPLFTDHAVLQRDKVVPVWGTASAGEKVSVTFAGKTVETTADAAGKWRVDLPAQAANATPADLVIKGNNTITLTDVLVGEVWLASGQSNMEWVVKNTYDNALDIPASVNFPLIRHVKVEKKVSAEPQTTSNGKWEVASPATTGGFSAVGYFFALDLFQQLRVPVGIVHSSWGGTPVESWIDAEAYKTVPAEAAKVNERWAKNLAEYPEKKAQFDANVAALKAEEAAAKAANQPFTKKIPPSWSGPQGPGHPNSPSGLNNGMIAPLVPYALRGAIWYQGESNVGRAPEYAALFPALIKGWRTQFAQQDLAFYWVQLSSFSNPAGDAWGFLREAQTKTLSLPNTGQAVTFDIGNTKDIHPRNKKDVGRRLARVALARTYKFDIIDSGPVIAKAEREGAGFRVSFNASPSAVIAPLVDVPGFQLAGEDKVFKPAQAKLENGTVLVTSTEVTEPIAVRYGWTNSPTPGLFNNEGLPAVPFRSDSW